MNTERALAELLSAVQARPPAGRDNSSPVKMPALGIRNLTQLARDGKLAPITGRDAEIQELLEILNQTRKANALLTGPAGAGKTAVVTGLAQVLTRHAAKLPGSLGKLQVLALDVNDLIAGTALVGALEERLAKLFNYLQGRPTVLFIDELHALYGAGAGWQGQNDATNLLKPLLLREGIRVIGATTDTEYHSIVASDAAFERRFSIVRIKPLDPQATVTAMQAYLRYRGVENVADTTLLQIAERALALIPGRASPDVAMDVLERALSIQQLYQCSVLDDTLLQHALFRTARLPVDIKQRLTTWAKQEGVANPAVQTLIRVLQGQLSPPAWLSYTEPELGERIAKALANMLGGRIDLNLSQLDLVPQSYNIQLLENNNHWGRQLHEHPFSLLVLRGDAQHDRNAAVIQRLRETGEMTDAKGRPVPVRVILNFPERTNKPRMGFVAECRAKPVTRS